MSFDKVGGQLYDAVEELASFIMCFRYCSVMTLEGLSNSLQRDIGLS